MSTSGGLVLSVDHIFAAIVLLCFASFVLMWRRL